MQLLRHLQANANPESRQIMRQKSNPTVNATRMASHMLEFYENACLS
jgi:hypothetical protein